MPRILLINTNTSWNKGSAAQVAGVMRGIRHFIPNADFSLISYCVHLDLPYAQHRQLKVVGYPDDLLQRLGKALTLYSARLAIAFVHAVLWRIASAFGIELRSLLGERFLAEYLDADIVIDLSGDSLSNVGSHPLPNFLGMLIAIILGKPLVVYSQSIGPFRQHSVPIARFCLNRARVITVRERITTEYLLRVGITPEITHEFGDCAFTMNAEAKSIVPNVLRDEGIPPPPPGGYIGISVSALVSEISRRGDHPRHLSTGETDPYLSVMLNIIDHLTEQGHNIILISHVIAPEFWIRDDRAACEEVLRHMKRHKDRVWILRKDYSPEELKAVISQCKVFIGSRMHACIASLSSHVPTVTLGWSHKYDGIMERLGMKDYSYAVQNVDERSLIERIDDVVECREDLSHALAASVAKEVESALEGASIICEILRAKGS